MTTILKKDLVFDQLRNNILTGELTGKLPKELDLARELGVGKITLRAALTKLQAEKLIARVHGRGTFVTSERERHVRQKTLLIIVDANLSWESPSNYIVPEAYQYTVQKEYKPEIMYTERVLALSDQELRTYLKRRNVSGILLVTSRFNGDEPILLKLKPLDIPVVLPHGRRNDGEVTGFGNIYIDAPLAVDSAIGYLASKGHKKIGFAGLKSSDVPFRKKSLQDVLAVLEKNGCSTNSAYFVEMFYGSDVSNGVLQIIDVDDPPTAIILFSDFFAVEAYRAIKGAGKSIPEDVSVLGICGNPDADMVTPHLTTIDFKYSLLARKGIDLLTRSDEWFKPGEKGPFVVSEFEIIERDSVRTIS